jgi:predicted ATPase/DNA-binding SARP family transcriptional activator
MSRLSLFLLGPPRIERDGVSVHVRRRKVVALIAYLAVTGRRHGRDTLATLFWPEHDQRQARGRLRRALSSLKEVLGEGWAEDKHPLDVGREAAGLNRGAEIWLDVAEFRDLLAECRAHGHPQDQTCPACLPLLAEATALYCDDFMAGFTLRDSPGFDDWQFFQAQGLRDLLANALQRLASGHGSLGEYEPAIAYARRWVALDPLHEPAHRCLMRLYTWSGQRAAALRQYGECERVLQGELGMPPQEETARLYRTIVERRDLLPPVEHAAARKHNLPVQLTPFVGRKAILAKIADCLQEPACRLLTLVGPGGSGKTRLALQAAADILSDTRPDRYPHGVYFVTLAALDSAETIVPAIASAIGFSLYAEQGRPQQPASSRRQLLDYLRQKMMLLILDNLEHLLPPSVPPARGGDEGQARGPGAGGDVPPACGGNEGGAGLVTDILKAAPKVKILATSRARLNVQGEHLLPIGGMDFPKPTSSTLSASTDIGRYGAVRLFLQGARRVQPDFELTSVNQADVVRICRLVDGLPLGVLLAAAWVRMLTPAEIAAQICGEIGQSLDFLETELHGVPARQRSMRAVFDHSWRLLSEREREVFKALSVFRGGFTRRAAQRVTGATLRELRALVDQSLLERDSRPDGHYRTHELLRQYATERLGATPAEEETARDRHCTYYAGFLQQREADLIGWNQKRALAEIEAEIENLRAGWNWAVAQGRIEDIDRSLESLAEFYHIRAWLQEGEQTFARAAQRLAGAQSEIVSRPEVSRESRIVLGKVLMQQGRFCDPLGLAEKGIELLQKSLAIFRDLGAQREMAYALCHVEDEPSYQEALAIFKEAGDRRGIALSLGGLAGVARGQGEYGAARQLFQESLAIFKEIGNQKEIAFSLHALGYTAWMLGEYEVAKELYQQSLVLYREIGDQRGVADSLEYLGFNALYGFREYDEAKQLLQESLAIYEEIGDLYGMAVALQCLGDLADLLGEYAEATQLAQRSLELAKKWRDATHVLMCLRVLGRAACGLGDLEGARRYLHQALGHALEMALTERAIPWVLASFDGIAMLLAGEGERERALEILTLVIHHPASMEAARDIAAPLVAKLEAELPPDVVAAASERGRAQGLEATVAELLVELSG